MGIFSSELDASVQTILMVVLGILIFFTTVFQIWKMIRDGAFVRLMLTRTYSWWGIFLVYILFFCLYPPLGHLGFFALAAFSFREILVNQKFIRVPPWIFASLIVVLAVQFLLPLLIPQIRVLLVLPVVGFIVIHLLTLMLVPVEENLKTGSFLLWAFLVSSMGFSHLNLLHAMRLNPGMQGLLVYYLFLTQFNDVLQFIWGTALGRHYIAPTISPKKTWEGLLGAIVTTMGIAISLRGITPLTLGQSAFVGAVLPIFGFLGDLMISALKRNVGVKDLGSLIPGHGGLLDRVDSILLSGVVYFYFVAF